MDPTDDLPSLSEQIDACRPASDDLALGELRPLAQRVEVDRELREALDRSQQFDLRVGEAIRQGPVPAGLAERLLARLEANRLEADQAAGGPADVTSADSVRPAAEPRPAAVDCPSQPAVEDNEPDGRPMPAAVPDVSDRSHSRRQWLSRAVALGAAAAIAVAVFVNWPQPPPPLSEEQLLNQAIAFFSAEDPPPVGKELAQVPPPSELPLDRGLYLGPGSTVRWRRVTELLGTTAVAYDLVRPGGGRATLYALKLPAARVANIPSGKPGFNTGGVYAGAWRAGPSSPLVYVLVVQGTENDYRRLFLPPNVT